MDRRPPLVLEIKRSRFIALHIFLLSDDFSSMFPSESADHNGVTYRTAYACQGQTLNISCPQSGDVIKVIRANYGRFSIAICNEEGRTDFSVNCLAPNSFRVMQERWVFRGLLKANALISGVFQIGKSYLGNYDQNMEDDKLKKRDRCPENEPISSSKCTFACMNYGWWELFLVVFYPGRSSKRWWTTSNSHCTWCNEIFF